MTPSSPYQPLLLRVLHGASAILTLCALVTGFWVYNTYDQRWGSLPLPKLDDIQGLHGTISLTFLLLLPVFALYSFHIGHRRLIQEQSLSQLKQIGQPIGWIALHRVANTLLLLSATFAVVSGRMMKEEWLPAGELNRFWYLAHLLAWLGVGLSVALHLLLSAKIGGVPLLFSIWSWRVQAADSTWWQGFRIKHPGLILGMLEVMVMGGILLAFVLPVFND